MSGYELPIINGEQSPAVVRLTGDIRRAGGDIHDAYDWAYWSFVPSAALVTDASGEVVGGTPTGLRIGHVGVERILFEDSELGREVRVEVWNAKPFMAALDRQAGGVSAGTHLVPDAMLGEEHKRLDVRCRITGRCAAEALDWPLLPDCRQVWGIAD